MLGLLEFCCITPWINWPGSKVLKEYLVTKVIWNGCRYIIGCLDNWCPHRTVRSMGKSERWNGNLLPLVFSLLDECQINNRHFSQVINKRIRGNSCLYVAGREILTTYKAKKSWRKWLSSRMAQRGCSMSVLLIHRLQLKLWSFSFALSKWLGKMTSKGPFQLESFLCLSALKNPNRELEKFH